MTADNPAVRGPSKLHSVARLHRELGQLFAMLGPGDFLQYLIYLATALPTVVRERTLVSVDRKMTGLISARVKGVVIQVPVGEITELLGDNDSTPTFGAVREMYASNVYLAPFNRNLQVRTVVDLGSNRGLFLLLAAKVLNAELAIGVEPSVYYTPVFESLLRANRLTGRSVHRINAFIASEAGPEDVTMDEIIERYKIERIEFLKCDIEGAEFDVFSKKNGFLERVDNIAMEIHPECGDVQALKDALEDYGLVMRITDQFGRDVAINQGVYLYATRNGCLVEA